MAKFADALPKDQRLALPFPAAFSVPLLLKYPGQGSILFESAKTGGDEAIAAINNIIFRLLSTHPPGKLSFTIFDPVGLGQNFAGLMHLADYEESHINSRIWTQSGQLEEKLAELNEHMEKVIQMYLRNEYETIAEYNAAGRHHRRKISSAGHRRFPGELQRNGRPPAHQHRHQRRALRRVHPHSLGQAPCPAAGFRGR